MKKIIFLILTALSMVGFSLKASATEFTLPVNGDTVIGKVQWMQSKAGDNFSKIGRHYDVGYFEMVEANPGVDPALPQPGTIVVIPSRFLIPHVPHKGVVINLAELRAYYFPPEANKVITYPIGIGREGWEIPLGVTSITAKVKNPTWIPTEHIRQWRQSQGVTLPLKVPPGPDNPLGAYALYLGIPTVRIHDTIDPDSVGRRSSAGCIHLWTEDVKQLFSKVRVGTPVRVINDPYKAGWLNNHVYLESHVPLEEQQDVYNKDLTPMHYDIDAVTTQRPAQIDWESARRIAQQQNGIPQVVGSAQ